jgi:hypothetical protein
VSGTTVVFHPTSESSSRLVLGIAEESQHAVDILEGRRALAHQNRIPGAGVAGQSIDASHEASAKRVPMHVPDESPKVDLVGNEIRAVAILEKMTYPVVATIEIAGVSRVEASHRLRQRQRPRPQREMHMVVHECPCEAVEVRLGEDPGEAVDEVPPIAIITKDGAPLDPPQDHVVNGTGRIEARTSRHEDPTSLRDRGATSL